MPAKLLGIRYSEEEYISRYNAIPRAHVGIARDVKVMYYKHMIDEMHIGHIILRKIPIEISFESQATAVLLGMPVLGLFNTQINAEFKTITFTETPELAEYTHNNKPIVDILSLCRDEYIDLTLEDLQAYRVRSLLENNKH